ncbi:hypothetical protein DIPPA_18577 [Diplonema papillatum]|nr:hypothetical protein DIPPA_18577 [Diplonema papillatum]
MNEADRALFIVNEARSSEPIRYVDDPTAWRPAAGYENEEGRRHPAVEGTTPARIREPGLTLRRKAKRSRADARQRTPDSSLAARFSDVFSILSSDSSEGTATGAPFPIFNDPPADGGAATLTPKRQRTSTIPQPKASASPAAARLCSKLKPASRVRACPPPAKVEKKVQNARAAGARRGDYTDIFAILSDSDEERPMRMDPQSTPRAPSPPSTAGTQSARAASSDAPAPRSPFADGRDPVVGERKATAGGDDAQNNPVTSPVPPRRQPASSGVSGGPRFNAPPVPKSALADGQCPGAGEQTSSRVGGAGDTPVGSLMPPPPQPASSGKPAAAKPQRAARKKPTAPPKAANDNNSKNKSSSTQNENNGSNGKTDTAGNTNQKKKNSNSNNQSNGGNGDKKRARPAAGAGAPNAKRQRPALPAGPSQPEPAVLPPEGAPPACKTGGAPVEPGGDNLLTASQGRTKLADSPEPAPCGAPAEPSQKTVGDPPTGESQAASSRASRADAPAAGASETRPAHRPLRKPRGKTGKNRSADVRAGSSETKPAVCTSKDGLADPQQAASSQAKPANKLGKLLKRPLKNDEEPSADVQAGSSETKPAVCTNKDGLQDGQEGSSEAKPAGSSTDQALEMPADDDKDSAADAQPTSSQVKPANKVGKVLNKPVKKGANCSAAVRAASSESGPADSSVKTLETPANNEEDSAADPQAAPSQPKLVMKVGKPLKKVGGNPSADVPAGSSETKPADSTDSTSGDPPANPQAASSQAKPATKLGKLLKKPLKKVGGNPSADVPTGSSETKPADSTGSTNEDPPANPQAASSQAKPATNLGKLLKKPLKKVGGTPSADESAGPSETKPADSAGGTIEDPPANPQAAASQAKPATKLGKLLKKPLKKVGGSPSANVPAGPSVTKPADSAGGTIEDPPANPQAAASQAKPANKPGKPQGKPAGKRAPPARPPRKPPGKGPPLAAKPAVSLAPVLLRPEGLRPLHREYARDIASFPSDKNELFLLDAVSLRALGRGSAALLQDLRAYARRCSYTEMLHAYNETKDVAEAVIGRIAELTETSTGRLHAQFLRQHRTTTQ